MVWKPAMMATPTPMMVAPLHAMSKPGGNVEGRPAIAARFAAMAFWSPMSFVTDSPWGD
jgi:hypothetical protein